MQNIRLSIISCLCTILTLGALAQNTYSLPQTVITVSVTAQKEVIKKGPYARFAQKYLGVVAPLSDKEFYTLKSAEMSYATENDPSATFTSLTGAISAMPLSPAKVISARARIANSEQTSKLQIDKQSPIEKSVEEMASEAANAIFTIRKRRIDLVTGESGENVFGAGLSSAIKEMRRLEDEYIALFLGTQEITTVSQKFTIVPTASKPNIMVCRFSESGGILPESDLSGRPVMLEMIPENSAKDNSSPVKSSKGKTLYYRIPDMVKCEIVDGTLVLTTTRMPIYQFGKTIMDKIN